MDSITARLNQRSALSFFVFVIFGLLTTLFILQKARQAVNEIQNLGTNPIYLTPKELPSE